MDQVRSEGGRPPNPQTQIIVLSQAPLDWNVPGAHCEGAVCPAPLFLEASAVETIMPTSTFGATHASEGGWLPSLPAQAPPPAAQLAPIVTSMNPGARPHGASREGSQGTSRPKASPDDSCNPKSVYVNFRRWQCFKALAREHLPQSPDVEALSCFLMAPLVAGDAGQRPVGTGTYNIVGQVRSEGGRPQPPQTQTIVLTQAPPNWNVPGAICGGAVCPAPLFLEASAVETIMPTSAFGGTQAREGDWRPSLPAQAPPPAAQLAPIVTSMNPGARPHGVSREGGLTTSRPKASQDDSCNPNSVYKNFRRWQRFKALARRHLPQSPDAEALSCFLIPVLRSLSRLKPTMTLEEGMWRAMHEWQCKSNFDRMIYYEMADKFMEFEAQEEMRFQKLQLKKGAQGQPPPAPPRPDPRGPRAPVVGPQPGTPAGSPRTPGQSNRAAPTAQRAHTHKRPQETESPDGIPPAAVQEYMDLMDELLGLGHSAAGEPGGEWEDGGKDLLPDKGLLSYLDQLCCQQDFVAEVEAVIHPGFVKQLLSPDTRQDPLALTKELEQEEGLTPSQLVEKRLLASGEQEGGQAPPSHGAPLLDSSPSESAAGQDAQRLDHSPQLGVSDKACPPDTDFKDRQSHCRAEAHLSRPKAFAVSSGRQEYPPLFARGTPSPPQGHRQAYSGLGPRDASIPRETSLVTETLGPVGRSSEDEEDLPSLAFLLGSPNSLLPCGLSLSPVPASGLACPGGRGPRGAAQSQFFQTLGLTRASPPASKSRKHALGGGPAHAEKTPLPGASLGVCGRPTLALELVCSSQPQKRKCDQSVTGSWKKRHCSQ
ncbi:PREDICTED: NUT family member 2G-like [Miniopterus natalensis]|uniref:NUT family member 2G-like n=1 Tax=Miniopterus natalensis TaxID=291302 RepID=UPI0007A6F857|nr:PREDICTED: NUT family member 2G-like [Miniopterus natalensis]